MLGRKIRKALEKGEVVIGTSMYELASPVVVKLAKRAGFDWLGLELEHMHIDPKEYLNICMTAVSEDLPLIVKIVQPTRPWVSRMMDAGASGVRLCMTESKEQVNDLVKYTKYPPTGGRAVFTGANINFDLTMDTARYIKEANDSTLVFAHIETVKGVQNVEDIVANPHLDVAIIGPYDLSVSLGVPGQTEHPKELRAIEKVIKACKKHGKAPGIYCDNAEVARRWYERGMRVLESGDDRGMLLTQMIEAEKGLRKAVTKKRR